MFRTGHRSDHAVEPAPEPTPLPAKPAPLTEKAPPAEPAAPVSAPAAPAAATVLAAQRSTVASETTIGNGVVLDGTLKFTGTMRMTGGRFSGKISSGDRLIVGAGAKLAALTTCASIEVHGEASGTLSAQDSVDLRAPARVSADVSSPSIAIEKGVHFEGTVQMRSGRAARPSRQDAPKPKAAEPSE